MEIEQSTYNTSTSRLWTRLRTLFKNEIAEEYKKMRAKNFTFEKYYEYFYGQQVSSIGIRQYNLNIYAKYIPFYSQYSHMLHGSRLEHMKRWLKERFIYLDSYFGYESPEIASSITVRINKSTGAISPLTINVKTYSPQYVKIRWRNEEGAGGEQQKEQVIKVGRNQEVAFTMNMPDVGDQEVLIFNAPQLKEIGDLSSLRPSVLLLSNARKLTKLVCRDTELLKKVELSANKMIQYIDLSGCSGLGTDQSGTTLDVTNCSNLKYLDVYGTSLLAVNTSTNGGNLEEIYYPYTVQSVQMVKQTNLKTLGIPYKIGTLNAYNFGASNVYCTELNEIYLEECPYLDKIGINKGTNKGYDHKNMIALSNARSATFKNSMNSIKYLDFSNCRRLETLVINDMYNIEELKLNDLQNLGLDLEVLYSLKNVNLSNCPSLHTIEMGSDQVYDGLKASCVFAKETTLDLSRCSGLKTIKSNYGIEGLKKIILPKSVENLIFEGSEDRVSDIESIYIDGIHTTDGFVGIDLQDLNLKDFCMESLVKVPKVLNLNITSHNYTPAINMIRDNVIYPYISPECTINLDEYKGNSLRGLYKGITGTGNGTFNVIISDENELPTVKDAEGMFQDTDLSEEETKRLYNKVFNIENASRMFKNNSNLSSLAVFYSNIVNAKEMFYNCVNLRRATFNLSSVLEECGQMFMNCKNLIQCPEVITDSVMNCEQMFYNCSELVTGPKKLGNSVQSCKQMFSECIKLERAVEDIVPSVTTCQHMFNDCFELLEAPLTLGGTNSKVSNCVRMFYECGKLVEAPSEIPNNVTTCAEMFVNCKSLVSGPIKIGTSVNSCVNMFNGCISLETVPESIPDNVTLCGSMFKECSSISDAPAYLGKSISNMNNMFENSGIRTCPDIPSSVKHMQNTFKGCTNLLEAPELSPNATNGVDMFKGCTSLVSTPSVIPSSFTGIQNMFEGCTSLVTTKFSVIPSTINTENGAEAVFKGCTSLVAGPSIIESGVIDAASMFEGCESLTTTPSNLGSTIIEMNSMFKGCSSLVQLTFKDLPATAKNLSSMFEDCKLLKSGPSNLSVAATDCSSMFRNCSSLLYTSDFASGTSLLTNCNNMYQKCTSITQSSRIPDCVLSVNNMFNGCENLITLANNGIRATTHNNFLTGCTNLATIREFNLTNFTNPLHASYFGSGANACSKLANITFIGSVRIPLNLGFTDNLTTIPTFESMVNALDQRTASSTLNLTISETSQKNLTTSQKATIASKYWTVSTPEN